MHENILSRPTPLLLEEICSPPLLRIIHYSFIIPTEIIPWWLERGGPTRYHSEHGSETPQR